MSKKIAAGADAIVLDVKTGKGAFMKTVEDAEALARLMVKIGQGVGRRVAAVLTDMNQPLGAAVGNALEVRESIETLQGGGPADFREHCLTIGGKMLELAGKARNLAEAEAILAGSLENGQAWAKFVEWITAQGGDRNQLDNPDLLPAASLVETVKASRGGYIAGIDAAEVGMTGVELGGGRARKGDPIDYAVGIICHAKVGAHLVENDPLFTIHANDRARLEAARQRLVAAVAWSDTTVAASPHTLKIIE
jgi:pyrimidine-nucleoside phosphorylase